MRLAAACLMTAACSGLPDGVLRYDLTMPASEEIMLARRLRVATERPTRLAVRLEHAEHEALISFEAEDVEHDVPLLGLLPDRTYDVVVELHGASGVTVIGDRVRTAALPEPWPDWELRTAVPTRMEPGLTLLGMRADEGGAEFLTAIDERGRVRWLQRLEGSTREVVTTDLRMLDDGSLLHTRNGEVLHTDLLGRTLHRLISAEADAAGPPAVRIDQVQGLFHHEVAPLPDGSGVYTLISNPLDVRGYPRSYTDASDVRVATIADDLVFEISWDGETGRAWSMAERLDPRRIGWDSLERRSGWMDWAHANAVVFDAASDAYIVTLRHQDAVVKLDRASGALLWILGNHDRWTAPWSDLLLEPSSSDFRWPWHAHAAEVTPSGTILVFDNHNYANTPLTGTPSVLPHQNTSRLVEYRVDESDGTVEQVWQFLEGPEGGFFAPAMGDADHQPQTRNVLGVWGRMTHERRRALAERGFGTQGVRILEVTRSPEPEVLFDLRLTSDAEELPSGWTCNRAERIPALYPPHVATMTRIR